MKIKHSAAAVATALTALAASMVACGGNDTVHVNSGTVLLNATIVSTEDGSLTPGQSIVIDAGKIVNITGKSIETGGTAQAIDASGKFVVPGLNDMHTHAMSAVDLPPVSG